jgi:hypothetical protein
MKRILVSLAMVAFTGSAFGQAPPQGNACDATAQVLATEFRLLRQLLEKQATQQAVTIRVSIITQRLGILQSRMDQLEDELDREQNQERDLVQARATAPEDSRPGLDQNISAAGVRLAELKRRISNVQSQIGKEEDLLAAALKTLQ